MYLCFHAYNTALGTMCDKSTLVPTLEWYTLNTQLSILVQGSIAMVTRDISCFSYRIYLYFQCYYNHWCLDCRTCVLNSFFHDYRI